MCVSEREKERKTEKERVSVWVGCTYVYTVERERSHDLKQCHMFVVCAVTSVHLNEP